MSLSDKMEHREGYDWFFKSDIKEFIKLLKEKIKHYRTATYNMKFLKELEREIDKLAGEKLR